MKMKSAELPTNPYDMFKSWLEEAKSSEVNDPNAMCLATADSHGRPSNRMVLLNGLDERGFVFYTNDESRKGRDIEQNPYAALCFHWKSLRRQVRIEGRIEHVTDFESDAYYNSRPRQSRIGAWASQQSRALPEFAELQDAVAFYENKFKDAETIPRPPYWKGFRVLPDKIEFWIDGEFRLHRRHVYIPAKDGWETHMIYP
ncbi:MAG: pyridoxamine 5'-phosphate oxidase [Micavibrio aeruginosavorus]|uniref:Pyridoxamine 5'-phosphate oxidase n=1 Tax=Micavibrio aeruginosavorus TaxID=349221 RepID=A0A2W5MTZ5_9BACT|nr:MAG: pyridoxamine 5'-phosphate oxidase [Micavibrio aeruginosavorus]